MKRNGKTRLLACILLVVFAGLAFSSALEKSATFDETHYLGLGRALLEGPRWDLPSALFHPPLSYYLHSLPLLFCTLEPSCFEPAGSGIQRGRCLLEKSEPAGDRLLLLARVPTLVLGVLLGWLVYSWASTLYGPGGGLFSLFLFCLCPNLLAHSILITPDLCLTTFGFLTVYLFWRCIGKPSSVRLILCGFSLGLTLLSKFSGLIWLPLLGVLALLAGRFPRGPLRDGARSPILDLGVVVILAFATVFAAYRFDITPYLSGMEIQRQTVGKGLPAFLNGQVSHEGGWWYYYLYAFAIKTPIPLLGILGLALWRWMKPSPILQRQQALFLLAPVALVFAVFSALDHVNIGLRYVLPSFPFLMVLAGGVTRLRQGKKAFRWLIVCPLLIWYGYENLSIHPHYLAYFNQFVGGSGKGYRHLVDSNLDWGQDLRELKKYMEKEGIDGIKLSYFGTADPGRYGIRYEALPSFVPLIPRTAPCREIRKGDLVAVSATNLYPLYVDLGPLAASLREMSPVGRAGYSILIYRMNRDVRLGERESVQPARAGG